MRSTIGLRPFVHILALALATAAAVPVSAQTNPPDVLLDQRMKVAATVNALEDAYEDEDELCRLLDYNAALAQLDAQVEEATRLARAARAAGPLSTVDADAAAARVEEYRGIAAKYRGRLKDCEGRGVADRAEAVHVLHIDAAAKCDRAQMKQRVEELEALEREARTILQTARLGGQFATISEKHALAQLRIIRDLLDKARKRPARNCPPDDANASPAPPAPGTGSQPTAPGSRPATPGAPPASQPAVPGTQPAKPETSPKAKPESQRPTGEADNVKAEVSLGGSIGEAEIPTAGIGVQRAGPPGTAPERFAGESLPRIGIYQIEAAADFRAADLPWRIGVSYAKGDGGNAFSVPAAPVDSGIVYGSLSPAGSSGVIAPFGLSGRTHVETSRIDIRVQTLLVHQDVGARPADPGAPGYEARLFFGYGRGETNHIASAQGLGKIGATVFDFAQERHQEIRDDLFEVGVDGALTVPLHGKFFAQFDAAAAAYYRDSRLTSMEWNRCNFCPAADRDFTIAIEDEHDGIGFKGDLAAAVAFRVSRDALLRIAIGMEYSSERAAIFNPGSGDQVFFEGRTTGLRVEDTWLWRVGVGLNVAF